MDPRASVLTTTPQRLKTPLNLREEQFRRNSYRQRNPPALVRFPDRLTPASTVPERLRTVRWRSTPSSRTPPRRRRRRREVSRSSRGLPSRLCAVYSNRRSPICWWLRAARSPGSRSTIDVDHRGRLHAARGRGRRTTVRRSRADRSPRRWWRTTGTNINSDIITHTYTTVFGRYTITAKITN